MWQYVGFATVAGVVCLIIWWFHPDSRRLREYKAELKIREPVSDEEMISRYFAADTAPAHIPVQVRQAFAKYLNYPTAKLLPDDDFAFLAALDMTDLIKYLEAGFGINFTKAELATTAFEIRSVSRLIADKLKPASMSS